MTTENPHQDFLNYLMDEGFSITPNINALSQPLTASEIEFRVQSINKGGYATILAYKNARVDMQRLDDAYGHGCWQRKHDLINGNLFCSVGVWNKSIGEWVWVQDVGKEFQAHGADVNGIKPKGQASDSFKRACFNLGIGRELYDYPVISIKLNPDEFKVEGNSVKQSYKLKINDWSWYTEFEEGKIAFIGCRDTAGKVRFEHGKLKGKK